MQRPLQITFHGMGPSEAIERHLRERAEWLERFHDGITGIHVVVDAPHQHHRKGKLYSVRVDIHVPGEELAVARGRRGQHAHEDVHVAIRDAFDAARRRVEDHARKRRHDVKRHEVPPHGRVVRIFHDDGYGFLETPDGLEVYFHEHSVSGGAFASLERGDDVRFVLAEDEGREGPQASTVVPVGKHHLVGGEG